MPRLTPRQERFVGEYLRDLNATAAARRAGYSCRTARVIGAELLAKGHIAAAIVKAQAERARLVGIEAERVLRELLALAFSSVSDFRIDEGGTVSPAPGAGPDAMRAIASVKRRTRRRGKQILETTVEVRFWDKTAALNLLMRHLGILSHNTQFPPNLNP